MDKGTIVLTQFPFTDLSAAKRRPAVILSKVDPADPDVIVGFISTIPSPFPSPCDYVLDVSHPDFVQTGLKKTSIFKLDKLATLDKSIFTGELGEVSPAIFEELKKKLRLGLDLPEAGETLNYAAQMRELANGEPWQDSTYEGKLAGLSAETAFRQPIPGIHSVAEILSHVRWWRHAILHRLQGGTTSKLSMTSPENWLSLENLQQEGWENIKADADQVRDEIIQLIENQTDDFLDRVFANVEGKDYDMRYLVQGVLQHDNYHLGQMALVLRILEVQDNLTLLD